MTLPEGYGHLMPWEKFVEQAVAGSKLDTRPGETPMRAGMRHLLQSLHEAGCLRRPETDEPDPTVVAPAMDIVTHGEALSKRGLRRVQKHINQSRGMEG